MNRSKLGRTSAHRRAMFRSIVTALLRHERISTTEAKAKQLRPIAEKLISLAGNDDLHARRLAARFIMDKEILNKLFNTIGPRYKDRPGGYTRIVKLGHRPGDSAPRVLVELI